MNIQQRHEISFDRETGEAHFANIETGEKFTVNIVDFSITYSPFVTITSEDIDLVVNKLQGE